MSLKQGTRRALFRGGGGGRGYQGKVLATGPIAYWMLNETSGLVAYDQIRSAQNGAHTGVTLGQAGIGDGRTSPLYDGANDYTNVHSAAFVAAFNGSAGTVMCWARMSGAGVWTDGTFRAAVRLTADGNNYIHIARGAVNNRLGLLYVAGGAVKDVLLDGLTATGWMHFALTWDKNAGGTGEVAGYYNGTQSGATLVNLGVWAGALSAVSTCIGSVTTVPANVWSGYIAHCAVWDRALSPAEIADLYVVE